MTDDVPRLVLRDTDRELAAVLQQLRVAILRHPAAAQALFSTFVGEGRQFAETPEGRAWVQRLSGSELMRQLRVGWDMGSAELLTEDRGALLPSTLVDALLQFAAHPHMERMLARMDGGDGTL